MASILLNDYHDSRGAAALTYFLGYENKEELQNTETSKEAGATVVKKKEL